VLYSFYGNGGSGTPFYVVPEQGRDSRLYGTTYGPSGSAGSAFAITTAGFERQIYTFGSDGSNPASGPTLATDGNLYGTTYDGGAQNLGVLYRLSPSGVYTVLHDFLGDTDGANPIASPIEASDGNLYGATLGVGGASTVYKYSFDGSFSTLFTFEQSQGQYVVGSLTEATDGSLYGAAEQGGSGTCGSLFQMSKSGTLLWNYGFSCNVGYLPASSLILASDGNLYGTTARGGVGIGCGTVFRVDQKRSVTPVYAFKNATDGCEPFGLTQANDDSLYGTTAFGGKGKNGGGGTIFKLSLDGVHTKLFDFDGRGEQPYAAPLQDTDGKFYGTTSVGGRAGYGSVYSLDMGLGPFATFVLPTGKVGQSAQILGQALTGTTSVTFNGIPATSFAVVKDTYMTAVVPAGATTGPVVVTTPGGKLTSNVNFRIIK